VRALQPLARGVVHGWRIVHTALTVGADARGGTRLVAGLRPLRSQLRRRGVVVVLSDLLRYGLEFQETPGFQLVQQAVLEYVMRRQHSDLQRRLG
jgi:hypothetical protein